MTQFRLLVKNIKKLKKRYRVDNTSSMKCDILPLIEGAIKFALDLSHLL